MAARILDGATLSAQLRAGLAERAAALRSRGVLPCLALVLAGEDPASAVYVRNKVRACEQAGIQSRLVRIPADAPADALHDCIEALNADPAVHGILVQLPLPAQFDVQAVVQCIDPAKDVDGFHASHLGEVLLGSSFLPPCTPAGVMRLLEDAAIAIEGRHAVVIGRSNIVGKPMALMLIQAGATVTVCHSRTSDLARHTGDADILVVAAGRPGLIDGDMVKRGAVVVDVGIHRLADGRLGGDVDYESVSMVAGHVTPVPGGVGPMTIAMLLANTLRAAQAFADAAAEANWRPKRMGGVHA